MGFVPPPITDPRLSFEENLAQLRAWHIQQQRLRAIAAALTSLGLAIALELANR